MRAKYVLIYHASILVALGGASAADLPSRKVAPVEYVRVCDTYGAGFYWIPGTDTCLKVGGRVRVDTWYTPAKNAVVHRTTGGGVIAANTFISSNGVDQFGWYARGSVMMDARTQSGWGTVQTVMSLRLMSASGLANTPPGYSAGAFAGGNASTANIDVAYIRFAGFTIGQTQSSNFIFLPDLSYGSIWSGGFPNGIRQLSYTATFGAGFSATLALENPGDVPNSTPINTLGANPFTATAAIPGSVIARLPNLVGNLRIDQSWGSAIVSGAVLQNSATFGNPALAAVGNTGPNMRRTGWAVGAGLRINLPMIAAGDHLYLWTAYGVGATGYVATATMNGNAGRTASFLGGFLRADRNMTLFCLNAACSVGGAEQARAFNFTAVLTHYWTPILRSNLVASYGAITPGTVTRSTAWTQGGLSSANVLGIMGSLIWSPVRNFDIGFELSYSRLRQSLPLAVPAGLAALASVNPSNWMGRMRIERTF